MADATQRLSVTLNEQQIETLGHNLLHPTDHPIPDEVELSIEMIEGIPHFLIDGAYLHSDGDPATWPEGHDAG